MNTEEIPEGMIQTDSKAGCVLGLTSDAFASKCQLFRRNRCMYIQAIEVHESLRKQGYTTRLFHKLWELGFTIKVPNPMPEFYQTLLRWGFDEGSEQTLTTSEPELDVILVKHPPEMFSPGD